MADTWKLIQLAPIYNDHIWIYDSFYTSHVTLCHVTYVV